MPQGAYPNRDSRQPTLLPNLDQPVVNNGVVGHESPAKFNADFPRTAASVAIAVGGTITNLDVITYTITHGSLPGGSLAIAVPVVSADTTDTLAHKTAKAINDALIGLFTNQVDRPYADVTAANTVTLFWPGPVGNSAILSKSVSGSATETATFTPSGGGLTGGAGPMIPTQNFNWSTGSQVASFFANKFYQLDSATLALMIAQGMPVS